MRGRKITTAVAGAAALPPGAIGGGIGGYGLGEPDRVAVSDDGRYVAFVAAADNLHPDAPLDGINVFRKDRHTGEVVLISRADGAAGAPALRPSGLPRISDDGNRVAFVTRVGLDPADVDGQDDVYVRDVAAGRTIRATPADANVSEYDLSGDGEWIAFATDASFVPGDLNGVEDVYRRRLDGVALIIASGRDGSHMAGNAAAGSPAISDDGGWVAFVSAATDLGSGAGGSGDVFVRDMGAVRTHLVSNQNGSRDVGSTGDDEGEPAIAGSPASGDTSRVFVAYSSDGTDIDPDDTDSAKSVFRRQLSEGRSRLVSRVDGIGGVSADRRAEAPSISDDGQRIAFSSDAGNLGAGGGQAGDYGVYVRNLAAGRTTLVSVDNDYAVNGAISGDGGIVAWFERHHATADGDPDLPGVFARAYAPPAALGPVGYVSRPAGDAPFMLSGLNVLTARSGTRKLSADGRYAVFSAVSRRLPGGGDGSTLQVYRRDTLTGATELVSRADGHDGAPGTGDSREATISADGTRVAFESHAPLDPADGDTGEDVYVRDLAAGTTRLVSRRSGADGQKAASNTFDPVISDDGRIVAFQSSDETLAPEAGPWGGVGQIVARDLTTHQNTLVSRAPGGAPADGYSAEPAIDADGSVVAFSSEATNLLPGRGGSSFYAVFARDMATGALAGPPAFGHVGSEPSTGAYNPALSADGQCLAFEAQGHNAITGAAGDLNALYVHVLSGACPKSPQVEQPGGREDDGRRATVAKPALTKVSLLRKRFRVGKGATAVSAAVEAGAAAPDATAAARRRGKKKRKPTPAGTAFRFTLNARANVGIAIERKTRGRKVGRQCRRATRKLRKKKACVRWVKAGALRRNGTAAGRRSVAFSGRIGRRALKPGAYRAVIKASNAAGSSKPVTVTFTVVRR